jgi:hypothetical protein
MIPIAQKLTQLSGPKITLWDRRSANPFQEQLEREHERGRQMAEAAANLRFAERLEAQAHELSLSHAAERARWASEEGEKLADALDRAIASLEERLQDDIARLLRPFLEEKLRAKVVADFGDALRTLLKNAGGTRIEVSGPSDLVEKFVGAVPARIDIVQAHDTAGCDVTARCDATVIETHLRQWLDAIGEKNA